MIPYIDKRKCAAQPDICPPIKECPKQAVSYVADINERIGGRIVIDIEKCEGCGRCSEICCGQCIEMREN